MTVTGAERAQVTAAELASFTRQLGAMLDAGVDVLRALRIAGQHAGNQSILDATHDIARRLGDGREFHQAIQQHPEVFDPFYVEMARQGETDGLLGKALLSVADYLDRVAQQPNAVAAREPAAHGPTFGVTAMVILGVQALGAGVIWSVATARPEILAIQWLGPLAALWAAICLLSGAWILHRLRHSGQPEAPARPAPLPPKTVERKKAETDAVVRNALLEQQEERETPGAQRVTLDKVPHRPNGKGKKHDETAPWEPDPEPPRFDL